MPLSDSEKKNLKLSYRIIFKKNIKVYVKRIELNKTQVWEDDHTCVFFFQLRSYMLYTTIHVIHKKKKNGRGMVG